MLGFARVVFSVFFSFSIPLVFWVLLMAYFFPSPDESDSKVFLRLDEKKEHNMIIGQSDQPECDICKTKL